MLERTLGEHITLKFDSPGPASIFATPHDRANRHQSIRQRPRRDAKADPRSLHRTDIDMNYALRNTEARVGLSSVERRGLGRRHGPGGVASHFRSLFHNQGSRKGTGLGLATVYGITKLHHGWIEVSATGQEAFQSIPARHTKPVDSFANRRCRGDVRGGNETYSSSRMSDLRLLTRTFWSAMDTAPGRRHRAEALNSGLTMRRKSICSSPTCHARRRHGWELAEKLRSDKPTKGHLRQRLQR